MAGYVRQLMVDHKRAMREQEERMATSQKAWQTHSEAQFEKFLAEHREEIARMEEKMDRAYQVPEPPPKKRKVADDWGPQLRIQQEHALQELRHTQEEEVGDDEEEYEEPMGYPDEEEEEEESPSGSPEPDTWNTPKEAPRFEEAPSPPDDVPSFQALVQRAATHFKLKLHTTPAPSSYLVEKLEEPSKAIPSLPLDSYIWQTGINLMKAPLSTPAVSARQERKYRVPETDPACLRGQLTTESIVVSVARQKSVNPATQTTVPPDKEARSTDLAGKRVIAAASLAVRTANYTAVLARYERDMWDGLAPLLKELPEESQQAAAHFLAEGRQTSNSLLKCALDASDTGFRQMSQGVVLRRQGWLKAAAFKPDVQTKVLDMPFEGTEVFGKQVETSLQGLKAEMETIKTIRPLTNKPGRLFRGRNSRRGGRFGPRQSGQTYHQNQYGQSSYNYGQYPQQQQQYQQYAPQQRFQNQRGRGTRRGTQGSGGRNAKTQQKQA